MERRFDIGLPVQMVHSHWEDFKREHADSPARLETEPAGGDRTRVRLLAPENSDAGALDALTLDFRHYLEAHGEARGLPRVARRDLFPQGAGRSR